MNDDDLDTALRHWADDQRAGVRDQTVPPIVDLLSGRRRRHNLAAIAASVVLVAAIAAGLGFGLQLGNAPTTVPVASGPSTTGVPTTGPCWQRFADAGSHFVGFHGVVVLRYEGSTACSISDQPQFALANAHGTVVGPFAATRLPVETRAINPGETLRIGVQIEKACLGIPDGHYSLLIQQHETDKPSRATAVGVPVGTLTFDPGADCVGVLVVPAVTTQFGVVGRARSKALKQLLPIARSLGARNGDPAASAMAVLTTYGAVEAQERDSSSDPSPETPVWLLQLRGHFVCDECRIPPGLAAPSGRYATEVLTASDLEEVEFGIPKTPLDLSQLGKTYALLP